jgi:hypothetical protein
MSARMIFNNSRAASHEVDNCYVVTGLTTHAPPVTEHKAQGGFEHCFIGLL